MLTRVWEYTVAPGRVDEFRRAYEASGDWARLFAEEPGFRGTQLFQSTSDPVHFLTVDRFESSESWRAFVAKWRLEYEALGARLAHVTLTNSEVASTDLR